MPTAYISMGSNLGEPPKQLEAALKRMTEIPDVTIEAVSSTYITEPQGCPKGTTWFYNKALRISCRESNPEYLLLSLQRIENEQGRVRPHVQRNSAAYLPRTIDLDLLLFDNLVMQTPELIIPHPRMHSRAFVLVPLLEVLLPGTAMPDGRSISGLLAALDYTIKNKQIWQTA